MSEGEVMELKAQGSVWELLDRIVKCWAAGGVCS